MLSRSLAVLLVCSAAYAAAPASPPPVALIDGKPITERELDSAIGRRLERLRAEEYRIKRAALDELIANALLERAATARGMTVSDLLAAEVEARVAAIDSTVLQKAWDTAKGPIRDLSEEKGKEQIARMMREMAVQKRRAAYVAELAKTANVVIRLDPPRMAIDSSSVYAAGDARAPVTIVAFNDFQCPYCANAATALRDIRSRYGKSLRVVYRHLPLPMHPNAAKAAEAAVCASEQGYFWEMGDRMFRNQRSLDPDSLKSFASTLRLDRAKFDDCLDSGRVAPAIAADVQLASSYGVQGTPTIFINGRWVVVPTFEDMSRTIEEELRTAGVDVAEPPAAGSR